MCIGIYGYDCRTAGEYPACPTIVNNISLAQNEAAGMLERELMASRVIATTQGVANFHARAMA